jgi:phenylalanyl-tRNA synthetase beta chain
VGFADIKGLVESVLDPFHLGKLTCRSADLAPYLDPGQAASVYCGEEQLGCFGRVNPRVQEAFDLKKAVFLFALDFDKAFALRQPHPLFRPLPRFPSVTRDIALILEESLPVQAVEDFIRLLGEPLLERMEIFDIYRHGQLGDARRSVGYRLVYRAADRSLTDSEVNEVHALIVQKVVAHFNATLRS